MPGKILVELDNKPILSYILERLTTSKLTNVLIVATSREPSDNPIAQYCQDNNVNCFRGSLDNVSQRFADCAIHCSLDYCVRINGDNLWTDARLIDQMIDLAISGNYDFVSNVPERTFGKGMSIEIVKTSHYISLLRVINTTPYYKEHVTPYLYDSSFENNNFYYKNTIIDVPKDLDLAIDNQKDFIFAKKIRSKMTKNHTLYGFKEIIDIVNSL